MKSHSLEKKLSNLKYSLFGFFLSNKIKIIILIAFVALGLFTGIFTAIKFSSGQGTIVYSDFGLKQFANGDIGTSSMFFQRFASYSVVLIVVCVCSLTSVLFPVGIILIAYRSFLLGLNVTFIIILYGVSGIITGILIIFPLQLLMLLLIILFFILAKNKCVVKSKYGTKNGINVFALLLVFILILSVVNLVETILLVITSAKVILII